MRQILALALSAGVVAASGQQTTPPQFRAGVEVTRLEVTVLDKKTRAPITGLTANDFIVKVNGRPQRVVSSAEVSVPGAANHAAPGIVEAARDVASNALTSPRLFVIVMNDVVGGNDPYYRNAGRAIANRIIDSLGPDDMASVVFIFDNKPAQDFSQDRALLRRAVDEYRPIAISPRLAMPMTTHVLLRALQFLGPMANYRRAVVFVSPAIRDLEEAKTDDVKRFTLHEEEVPNEFDVAAMARGGRLAQVPVYTFSAQGLGVPTVSDIVQSVKGPPAFQWLDNHADTLRTIASLTGGRATVATNAPADGVPAMFNELSSYYALAYEPTDPADGRLRRLDVQVTRPDAMVISSRQVRASSATASTSARLKAEASGTGLKTALESPLSIGSLPLRLAAVPLAVNGAREHPLVMTLALPPLASADRFRIRLLVFDGEGRQQFIDTTRGVDLPKSPDAESTEVVMRTQLKPGRYNVRVAVERASDDVAGTVYATIDVPNFAREKLSLSGVAIGRGDGRRIVGRQEIDGLLPFAPTSVRAFDATDRVGALLRVHQGSARPAAVTMTTSIADADGAVRFTQSQKIAPAAFVNGAAEHRFEMPLSNLPPGAYLLRFVATAGESTARREVRFFIR